MATFLDIGLTQYFGVIFAFLFVFTIVYAILQYSKLLGDNKGIHSIIALTIAFFTMLSDKMSKIITDLSPIFVVMMVFILLLLMVYKMFGMEEKWITELIQGGDNSLRYFILVLAFVVLLGVIANVYGSELLQYTTTDTGSVTQNIGATLFNPKILGFGLVMLIAVFSIMMLAKSKSA